jgi:Cu+-exporting ATPase
MSRLESLSLQAEGITCTGCAQDLETVLKGIDGIHEARVSFREERISILFGPEVIGRKKVLHIVSKMGFRPRAIQGTPD